MRHVLIGNDDGVHAPGLRALADAFLADGWRVTVSAPDQERSAASHSITIKRPMVAQRVETWEGVPQGAPLAVWAVDGAPADCVKLALHELCDGAPDLVASGINNGWNVGTDVHYSGTVGAAMEAAFEDYLAMAVSAEGTGPMRPSPEQYACAARMAVQCADRLLKAPLPKPSVLNLNLPDCAPCDVRGLVEAPLTQIRYTDAYNRLEHSNGRAAYWITGEIIKEGTTPGGDLDMLLKGYATVTAIGWDLTMRGACEGLLGE